jgi:anti-sigma factor RsiW
VTDFNNSFYSLNSSNSDDGPADCDAFWEMLSAYADGLLETDDSLRVEKHVAACDACALDLRFMRETSVLLANTPDIAPPPGLQQSILAATIYRPTWQQRLRDSIRYWLVPTRSLTLYFI